MSNEVSFCPHCKNTRGFVFGTCIMCGYNYLDGTFHFVKVTRVDELPHDMIQDHARRTRDQFALPGVQYGDRQEQ